MKNKIDYHVAFRWNTDHDMNKSESHATLVVKNANFPWQQQTVGTNNKTVL